MKNSIKSMKFFILISMIILGMVAESKGQWIKINETGGTPNAAAALDIESINKGLLIPRMSFSQRNLISTPPEALLIYQTDSNPGFYFYNGFNWIGFRRPYPVLVDADIDTRIELEKLPDEDRIRFTLGGTEYLILDSGRLDIKNTGGSVFIGNLAGKMEDRNNRYNVFIGEEVGTVSTSGGSNVAVGGYALHLNSTGNFNIAIGRSAMNYNTVGADNTAVGMAALNNNVGAGRNTAIGFYSMVNAYNTATPTTTDNTAIGAYSLAGSSTPSSNSGTFNVAAGSYTLYNNSSGSGNVALGYQTLYSNNSGNSNIGIGQSALFYNSTGTYNVAIGQSAMYNNSTYSECIAVGSSALEASTAGRQVAIGHSAGKNTTTGGNNVFIGYGTGLTNLTGSTITLIGSGANVSGTALTGATAIGANAVVGSSNSIVLGTTSSRVGIGTTTPSIASKLHLVGNGNGSTVQINDDAVTNGSLLYMSSSATTGTASNMSRMITLLRSGTNTNSVHSAYGIYSEISNTGTASINVAGYFSAVNGASNYGILVPNGNVGIGTTAPNYPLEISQTTASTTPMLTVLNGHASGDASIRLSGGSTHFVVGADASVNSFVISNTSAALGTNNVLSINSSGNVGLGGAPSYGRLDVSGGSAIVRPNSSDLTKMLLLDDISGAARVYTDADSGTPYDLILGTYPNGHTNQLYLKQSNAYVGLGTNNPAERLDVQGRIYISSGTAPGTATDRLYNVSGNLYWNGSRLDYGISPWGISGNASTNAASHFVGTTDAVALSFRTNNTIRLRIAATGQLEQLNNGQSVFMGEGAGINDDLTNRRNVLIGYQSGNTNATGSLNVGIGYRSLYNNSGSSNVSIGGSAMQAVGGGTNCVAVGYGSLINNTASNITAIGYASASTNTTGLYNVAVGYRTLYSNSTGYSNTAVGWDALFTATSSGNTAIGDYAGRIISTGEYNTVIGQSAAGSLSTGSYNTLIGRNANVDAAGRTNTIIVSSGSAHLLTSGDNQVRIGNSAVTSIGGQVAWTALSDRRVKSEVREDVPGLALINSLRPVTYRYNLQGSYEINGICATGYTSEAKIEQLRFSGFIAQEVDSVARSIGLEFGAVDKPENGTGLWGLRYAEITVPLVKAVQELSAENSELKSQISSVRQQVAELEKQNRDMREWLEKELRPYKQSLVEK